MRANLIALATGYAKAVGCPLSAVSRKFYGNSTFMDAFKAGASISIDNYWDVATAIRKAWPKGAERPFLRAVVIPNGAGR